MFTPQDRPLSDSAPLAAPRPLGPPLGDLHPSRAAVFLDFDGVLVDLAATPDAIVVPPDLPGLLRRLAAATGGSCAIVTGREAAVLRGFLPDLPLPIVGSHGAERADPGGPVRQHPAAGGDTVARLHRLVTSLRCLSERLVVECKPTGAVIHYRQAPEVQGDLHRAMHAIAEAHPGFSAHAAKMALELRPDDVGKDMAVIDLMHGPACAGRVPVYVGDDLTDEPAMGWVQARGGIAIKVGEGASVAKDRLADPAAVRAHLADWLARAAAEPDLAEGVARG
jgi:trehalose 6-phosphate phosphatase